MNQQNSSLPESQIEELIQFISDEKEARETLQGLASKLTTELEGLKNSKQTTPVNGSKAQNNIYSNSTYVSNDKGWGSRRMNKQAKYGRFEAQQQLDAEIRAKQQVQEELRRLRAKSDETEKQLYSATKKVRVFVEIGDYNVFILDPRTRKSSQ